MNTLSEVLPHLSEQKKELDSLRPLTPEQVGRIDQHFRLLLNYHSNSLEGNSLDYGETKMVVLHGMTANGKPLRDHFEIIGHNEALKWIGGLIDGQEPLTERFIRELHVMVLKERHRKEVQTPDGGRGHAWVEVGQYKDKPNHVQTSTGEIFYFASVEDTPIRMRELVGWFNEEARKAELHPLLLAAELHYRFVRIHPFDDGNGRVARLLLSFSLLRFGYSHLVVRTETKADYLTSLEAYDDGNKEVFYQFLAEALSESMKLMLKGAKGEPLEEEEDWKKRLRVLQQSIAEDPVPTEARSGELLALRLKDSFIPVYKELVAALKPFDTVYEKKGHEPDRYIGGDYNVPGVTEKMLIGELSQSTLKSFSFQLRWEAMKNSGAESFGNGVSISFNCKRKFVYTITTSETDGAFIKNRYVDPLTEAQRKHLVNTVARRLVQRLENQFNEVQRLKNEEL